jgi:hypothetical protein
MANVCESCSTSVYRTIFNPAKKQWLGVECGCTRRARAMVSTVNPFDLTLQHVFGADGKPLRVENLRQLSRAEDTYGFQSCVLSRDAQNFDDPPQQPKVDVAALHNWKFSSREQYERNRARR